MAWFRRTSGESPETLADLAAASENAAQAMRSGPDSSPAREIDADAMDRQAKALRRQAAKARGNGK